jgi:hypothetical protein
LVVVSGQISAPHETFGVHCALTRIIPDKMNAVVKSSFLIIISGFKFY